MNARPQFQSIEDVTVVLDDDRYGSTPAKGGITSIQNWLNTGQNSQTDVQYDSFGNVKSETDALGRTSRYSYDYLTNTFPTGIINPAGHVTYFNYDAGTGNLLWQKKNDIITYFEYDNFSRIAKEVQPYDTSTFPTRNYTYLFDGTPPELVIVKQKTSTNKTLDTYYLYDSFGQLVQVKTPATDNRQVVKNFFYDSQGRVNAEQNPYFDTFSTALATVSSTAAYANYTYDAISRVTNVTFPDFTNIIVVFDHWTVSTYDQNMHRKDYYLDSYDRITKITEYNIDTQLDDGVVYLYNTTYGYDEADQLLRIVDAYGNNFTFTFDSLGRRTRLNDPDIGEWNYTYDLAGNLVSQAGGGGNLITGDGFYREYNSLNQLIKIRNGSNSSNAVIEEYFYDPYGERVKIWRNDSAGTVVYTPFRELMQVRNSTGIYNYSYIYDGSTLIARVNPDNTKHYYHPDHLGSTTLITDESGNTVEETFYEPFGDVISGGSSEVKLYTGQFSDELTGQYYYGSRYYKPTTGFIQPDPIIQELYNPQNLNRYSYTLDNPYKYVDSTGNTFLAVNPWTLVMGENTIAYNPANNPIFWQRDIAFKPGEEMFRQGKINEMLKNQGYKYPEELPEGHWVRGLLDKFKWRGMAKLGPEGNADVIRWDVADPKTPYPHINRAIYRIGKDGKPEITSPKDTYMDHMPFYIFLAQVNQQALQNLIQDMRQEGSSKAVFGEGGGHGYVPGIGYVSEDGRVYPTGNPNWRPGCNRGCKSQSTVK